MSNATIIKCVAIDDEPLALEVIDKFCARIGGIGLRTFSDPEAGMEYIKRERPQLVFLDIEMENVSGLEIAAQLPPGTCFVFTTAYLDYTLEGYELDAVDYLHKPFAFARFNTAFNKALRRIGMNPGDNRTITVKQEYNNVSIPLSEILYVEAMEGYVKIFRLNNVCTVSRMILKNIGAQLPAAEFVRIHRSYIVARSKIARYNKHEVQLADGAVLPVGRQYAAEIMDLIGANT